MRPLINGEPAPDECWEELAEHALTHEDMISTDCPYCRTAIWGMASDIDSGLRKHIEHCEMQQPGL
jgi:hypothetical protein